MSAAQQAKAKRRKMRNGYAHLGNSMRRPKGSSLSRAVAAIETQAKVKKK